ncbi:MAG: vWA domain-containing protein [Myxococcota bacterium]
MAWFAAFLGLLVVGCGSSPVAAQGNGTRTRVRVQASGDDGWIGGSPMHTRVVVGEDGETYVGVWLEAPDQTPAATERAPMALSLVIDTSGSMSGEKITHARMAAQSLLESLSDGDLVSIYGFSDQVVEIAPPTVVGAETRPSLMGRITHLNARGGTALYGGLRVGIDGMRQVTGAHPVRRVVVISDGHANIGPSDPVSMGNLAAQGTEWGAQVTTIGVGLGYDEHTLGEMAVRSAGRLYHLGESSQMAAILRQELNLLARTVATDAHLEIVPAPGVRILGSKTPGAEVRGDKVRVKLGSVHAGQEREVLLRAELDTSRPGERPVGTARLVYRKPNGGAAPVVQRKRLAYHVTRDRAAARRSRASRVAAMVAGYEAAEAQRRAAQHLNSGDGRAAASELEQAERKLRSAAAQAPAPVRKKLERRARSVGGAARRARSVRSASEGRGAALEAHDSAMEAVGF